MLKTESNTWAKIAAEATISNFRIFGVIVPMNSD